jgi:hypothetical protein
LQKQLKNVVKQDFEFRTTRNGTKIITKNMADFHAIKSHFDAIKLSYYTFFPKSEKPIKAVIRRLPTNTPAEDICGGLMSLGFDVVSVKADDDHPLVPSRRSKNNKPAPYLVTIPRTPKSQEIFQLPYLCHISIKVEDYRAQSAFTQCHNCQQFGHVWVNCKQPPHRLWCEGGHLHKECPERENAASTPACCNCKLLEGETPHPANYRDCRSYRRGNHRKHPELQPKG